MKRKERRLIELRHLPWVLAVLTAAMVLILLARFYGFEYLSI